MNYKKILKGGYNEENMIKLFFTIVILGYFGVKIVYAFFFGFYPDKYYNRDIQINSNQSDPNNIKDIVVNAYVPGLWNNEITDFITTIVLSYIIYIFTSLSTKNFVNSNGNLELSFLLGYIIGLGYPPFYTFYLNRINATNDPSNNIFINIYISIIIIFIIFSIIINYTGSSENSSNNGYLIYLMIFFLLIFGLFLSRKITNNYSSVTYFYNNGENCTFSKKGIIQSSGDKLNITTPFLSFVILLLFCYQPRKESLKNLYIFVYALLLGILISGISYFGMEYFLIKHPQKECSNIKDCIIRDLNYVNKNMYRSKNIGEDSLKELKELTNSNNVNLSEDSEDINDEIIKELNKYNKSTKKFSIFKLVILILIILIFIYLVYIYFK